MGVEKVFGQMLEHIEIKIRNIIFIIMIIIQLSYILTILLNTLINNKSSHSSFSQKDIFFYCTTTDN